MTKANPTSKKMASTIFFLPVAILAIFAASATATDYIVGDQYGWTTNVDYQAWAKGKQFVVGDRLIFKYQAGANTVYKVDGAAFKECIPPKSEPLTTGNDMIVLATPGRKWYISGVGQYCKLGQKLVITVSDKPEALAPAPSSWPRKMFPAPFPAPVSYPPSWPIVVPPMPAQVPSPPSWPTYPAPVPAPATPYWPLPIVFPPSTAPAPAIPYFPWPFPPFEVPAPAPNPGGY